MRNRTIASWMTATVLSACGGGTEGAARPISSASAKPSASHVALADPASASAPVITTPPPPPPPRVGLKDAVTNLIAANTTGFQAHDSKKIADLYARDAVIANPGPNGMEDTSPSAMARDLDALFVAFPDAQFSATRVLGKGNLAIVEWIISGTNRGDFMGHRPTNQSIGYRGVSLLVFSDFGIVKHETMYFDMPTVLGQLGLGKTSQKSRPPVKATTTPPEMVFVDGPATGSVDDAKPLTAFYLASDQHDDKAVGALLADSVLSSAVFLPADQKKSDLVKSVKESAKAFPDAKTNPVACWSFGDWSACETVWSATWKGPAMGMKANNKNGSVHDVDIVKVDAGKISSFESFGNGSEFASSFGLSEDKTKPATDEVKLTGSKPAPKPKKAPASKP